MLQSDQNDFYPDEDISITAAAPSRPTSIVPPDNRATPPVSMLDRVTCILELFDHPRHRLSLDMITRRTGLPRSTAHRILEHMISLSWLSRSEKGYSLGVRVSGLAHRVGDTEMLRYAAAPVLHDLSVSTGRVVHLAMLEGANIVYLDKVGSRHSDVPTRVGARASAARTSLGMAMLACMRPEQVEAQLIGTECSPPTRDAFGNLHSQLDKVRQRKGVAVERFTNVPLLASVAIPLFANDIDRGCPIGAISLVCGAEENLPNVAPPLVRSAREIALELQRSRLARRGDDLRIAT